MLLAQLSNKWLSTQKETWKLYMKSKTNVILFPLLCTVLWSTSLHACFQAEALSLYVVKFSLTFMESKNEVFKLHLYHSIWNKRFQVITSISNWLCVFLFLFKIPALKTLDPELIHVEIIYDNNGKCGKSSYCLYCRGKEHACAKIDYVNVMLMLITFYSR